MRSFDAEIIRQRRGSADSVQDVQNQSQHDECCTQPLGSHCQLSIEAAGIATGQESISLGATDAVGQTGVLAGLEQNGQANHQTAEELKNSNNDDCDFHVE